MAINYLDGVDRCYAALEKTNGFNDLTRDLGAHLGAVAGDIVLENAGTGKVRAFGSFGFDPVFRQSYDEDFVAANPWVETLQQQGPYHVCTDIEDRPGYLDSAYYNDWVRPQGLGRSIGAHLTAFPGQTVWIGFVREAGDAAFSDAQAMELERLLPHLNRALALAGRMEPTRGNAAAHVVATLTEPAVLVSGDGAIIDMNAAASGLMTGQRVGRAGGNRMVLANPSENKLFREALVAVTSIMNSDAPPMDPAGQVCLAHDREGGVTALKIMPCSLTDPVIGSVRRLALVLLCDWQAECQGVDLRPLELEYGLTPTEKDLVTHLACGGLLDAFAQVRGMALSTARWHLKNAEAKTGTGRAEQLVALAHQFGFRYSTCDDGEF